MQERINQVTQQNQQLTLSAQQLQKTRPSIVPKLLRASEGFQTPKAGKQQNKSVLEEDGIQCFDLENNSLSSLNGDSEFLRMSLGNVEKLVQQLSCGNLAEQSLPNGTSEMNEQLKLWQELEKQKRENESLLQQLEALESDKKTNFVERGKTQVDRLLIFCVLENYVAVKEEHEMLKEEIVLKEEDLQKYQRHCESISDEVSLVVGC